MVCTKDQQGFLGDPGLEGHMDAFISTYVFDLLSDAEIADALTLAWRWAVDAIQRIYRHLQHFALSLTIP